MKKAFASIPFVARRRRRSATERSAKIGGPALLTAGGAAIAFLVRRRRRSAAGFDASPSELAGSPAGASATSHGDAADAPPKNEGRPSTLEGDAAESVPAAGAAGAGEGTVIPDTGNADPVVREAEDAAAAEAANIGGQVPAVPAAEDPEFGADPATQPVEEHSGSGYESFSERES